MYVGDIFVNGRINLQTREPCCTNPAKYIKHSEGWAAPDFNKNLMFNVASVCLEKVIKLIVKLLP